MERLIESALAPGRSIFYNANFDFVPDLEAVEEQLLLETKELERLADLLGQSKDRIHNRAGGEETREDPPLT
jgi:hypothetical protein